MRKNEQGATVIVVISVIAVLAIFTGAALDYTSSVARNVHRSVNLSSAEAIGNGCLQNEFMYWREICRENESPSSPGKPSSFFTGIPLPTTTQFPNVPNFTVTTGSNVGNAYTVSNYQVVAVTPQLTALSGTSAPPPGYGQVSPTGSGSVTYNYLASADITLPDRGLPVQFKVRQNFQKQYVSPWAYAIFFVDDLEIHPGPLFTINGWVQTNGNLYTGHNTLTFTDKVNYGNDWYIGFMPGDSTHPETPQPPNWPANLPPAQATQQQPFGIDPTRLFSSSSDNATGYHELIEVPDFSQQDPLAYRRYCSIAGVKIGINGDGTYTIYDGSGSNASNNYNSYVPVSASSTGNQKALYTVFSSAISFSTIQDNRQDSTIKVTNFDVSKITAALSGTNGALKNYPFNGIIYAVDLSASTSGGSPQCAMRLQNGSVLPPTGLTFASGNPIYVQGDFNTGGTPPSDNSSNPNPLQPTVSGYTKAPCAIIGDAVDILSNAWSDANSTKSLSSRVATNTTVNAAIVSGNVPTGNGNYSGGAENFPRFLEDWSHANFTYYGSMVELFQSQEATGVWGQANVYNPPTRNWYFDRNFLTNPPPGSPMVVNYLKGPWWQG